MSGSFPTRRSHPPCRRILLRRCARHEQNGLALHPRTAIPDWRGEPFDLGYAIDVLHPRALKRQDRRPEPPR